MSTAFACMFVNVPFTHPVQAKYISWTVDHCMGRELFVYGLLSIPGRVGMSAILLAMDVSIRIRNRMSNLRTQ